MPVLLGGKGVSHVGWGTVTYHPREECGGGQAISVRGLMSWLAEIFRRLVETTTMLHHGGRPARLLRPAAKPGAREL